MRGQHRLILLTNDMHRKADLLLQYTPPLYFNNHYSIRKSLFLVLTESNLPLNKSSELLKTFEEVFPKECQTIINIQNLLM